MVNFRRIVVVCTLVTACNASAQTRDLSAHSEHISLPFLSEWQNLQTVEFNTPKLSFAPNSIESPSKTIQGTAFWQSFLVPGLGQLSTGRKTTGYAFLATEAALIGGLVGLRVIAGRLEDDYRLFADQHAGVAQDQEHQYYVDLGNWLDVRDYNEARLRDRSYDAMYTDPGDAWHWDSDANRISFKNMRIDSDEARGQALLLVGGLVLNHLFSAVDAARGAARKYELGYEPYREGGGRVNLGILLR